MDAEKSRHIKPCPIGGSLKVLQEAPVTHSDPYMAFAIYSKEKKHRIYSGPPETVVLTLIVRAWGDPNLKIEVLVNGSSIPNGKMTVTGNKARTFKINRAKTIDVAKVSGEKAECSYFISIPL